MAIGHPLSATGTRIFGTLWRSLSLTNKKFGLAAIWNGGGGSTSMIIESIKY